MHITTSADGFAPVVSGLPRRAADKVRTLALRNPITQRRTESLRRRVLTREFLDSTEYNRLMIRDLELGVDGLNSAERMTPNYRWRHFKRAAALGAWRWLGVYENSEFLIPLVFGDGAGLDFGGARGPIGLDVPVCDRLETDVFGCPVEYRDLKAVKNRSLDYVFSSHALEHIPALDGTLQLLSRKLKPGGVLVLNLPAYTCMRWRAGTHAYADEQGDSPHVHTFYLALDPAVPAALRAATSAVAIDVAVRKHFTVEDARMVGDNSIWIVARRG
jgi:SAM-dependent methyltransferase